MHFYNYLFLFCTVNLNLLFKLKTAKLFQKKKSSTETSFLDFLEDVFAIEQIAFCSESRILCVAGASSHVIVFKFNKNEASSEIPVSFFTLKLVSLGH